MTEPTTLDIVTLVVAIIGALTGIAALVWQAVEFSLTGARVRVTLKSAIVGPSGAIVADGAKAWEQAEMYAADGYTDPAYGEITVVGGLLCFVPAALLHSTEDHFCAPDAAVPT